MLFHLPWTNEEIEACCFYSAIYYKYSVITSKYAALCPVEVIFSFSKEPCHVFLKSHCDLEVTEDYSLSLSLFFLQQKPVIAIISYWSRCGHSRPQWLLLPLPFGNSTLEGITNGDLKVCRNLAHLTVGLSKPWRQNLCHLCWSKLLWHAQIIAQHAFLQLFLS